MNMPSNHIIPLESIQIASPCRADWDQMDGDEQARFCGSCAKNVYNLSAMTKAEAEQLIKEKEGHLCVQLHRRMDGTIITSDCPVGISPVRRPISFLRGFLTAAIAAVLGIFGVQSTQAVERGAMTVSSPRLPPPFTTRTMGIVAMPRPTAAAKPPARKESKPKKKTALKPVAKKAAKPNPNHPSR